MPRTCIDTADAIELTETLRLIARWLADDPEFLLGEDPPSRPQLSAAVTAAPPARPVPGIWSGGDSPRPSPGGPA